MLADIQQFLFGVGHCPVHLSPGNLSVPEVSVPEGNTAHVQAFQLLGLETLADNELGTAAANIDHQPAPDIVRKGMGYTQINQARFLAPGNDLHGIAENLLRAGHELMGVTSHPEGVGADNLYSLRWHPLKALGKPAQTAQRALLGLFSQPVVLIQTCAQLDLFPHLLERTDFSMYESGNHHVEAVRAHVDGCKHLWRGRSVFGGGGGRHVVEILLG